MENSNSFIPYDVSYRAPDSDIPGIITGHQSIGSDGNHYSDFKPLVEGFNQSIIPSSKIEPWSILDWAKRYLNAGLCVIPVKADGSKRPDLKSWAPFQEDKPTLKGIESWFRKGKAPAGIAIVCGDVSGNLEVIDIDDPEIVSLFLDLIGEHRPDLLNTLVIHKTPRDGRHILYRCLTIEGNLKLAMRRLDQNKLDTLIETRGEGGYFIAPGSSPHTHKTGNCYLTNQRCVEEIPIISYEDRDFLFDCARSFNELIEESRDKTYSPDPKQNPDLKPGDDFNQRGDVRAVLTRNGWSQSRIRSRKGELWIRPGGDRPSGCLFSDSNLFYVFTTNSNLPFNRTHSGFGLLAHLEHSGDFKAAARALAKEGYGDKPKPSIAKPAAKTETTFAGLTFKTGTDGVFAHDEEGNKHWICSELRIEANTRDTNSENWGILLRFPDRDGIWHSWAMPMELLAGESRGYRERLLNMGLVICPGERANKYLNMYLNTSPTNKALCVTRQGWHRGETFIFPNETIGGDEAEPIYLQTMGGSHMYNISGTADEWKNEIGRYCSGNTRLIMGVSIAFASALLSPFDEESGGFHFHAQTSKGKTTTLLVAGSVHGSDGDRGFIRRWRATINGLETVATSHHDSLLCLDEIAECKPDDVNEAAYMLANGQGKFRQGRSGDLRKTSQWKLFFLSSGEISLSEHIATSGKRVRGGQEVRVINLPAEAGADMGVFEELHGVKTPDEFARRLQKASKRIYGSPIRAFIKKISGNHSELAKRYKQFSKELTAKMLPTTHPSEIGRAAHRFALVAFSGELATEYGLTGWKKGEAENSAKILFQEWIDHRGGLKSSEEEMAVAQVSKFLEEHGQSRFQSLHPILRSNGEEIREKIFNRAGYLEDDVEAKEGFIYYILPQVFKQEVCRGFAPGQVLKALDSIGCLLKTHDLRFEKRLPEGKQKVYAIRSSFLNA